MNERERVPLYNTEIEAALIGLVMVDNSVMAAACAELEPEHFYEGVFAEFFATCRDMIAKGSKVSPITLNAYYQTNETVQGFGGTSFLARLAANATTPISAPGYARVIRDLYVRRKAVEEAERAISDLETLPIDEMGSDYAAGMSQRLSELAAQGITRKTRFTFAETVVDAIDHAVGAYQHYGKRPDAVPSHIAALDNLLGGFVLGDLIILAGRPAMGKEQPIDAPVLTPHGYRTIGSLVPGDHVIGADGTPVTVIGTFPQGVKQAYKVTFADGSSAECGLDHLWTVYPYCGRKRHIPTTRTLRELIDLGIRRKKNDRRIGAKWRVPVVAPVQFAKSQPLPVDPYLLGVLIGDGATSGSDFRFSNPDMDSDIREKVLAALPPDTRMTENRSGACPYFNIVGPGKLLLRQAVRELGLAVKSGEKFIPHPYAVASVDDRKKLLAGLLDTDGSSRNGKTEFYSTSRRLALGVVDLVRSLGGIARIKFYDRSHHGKSGEYVVRIRTSFCPFSTSRKVAEWSPAPLSRYIVKVEKSRVVDQVCISLDAQDGLYITSDYIVTHNTALAIEIARLSAMNGVPCDYSSLEMAAYQLGVRAISASMHGPKVPYQRILWGKFSENEFNDIVEAANAIKSWPLTIIDQDRMTLAGLRSEIARSKAKRPDTKLIVIDYLGLIQSGTSGRSSRTDEVGQITAELKRMARQFQVVLIVLAQLSRGVEQRDNKRPQLSDLRESGSIEQDADLVIFPFREAYYVGREEPPIGTTEHMAWQDKMATIADTMEIIVAKNRQGRTGTVKVRADMATNTFHSIDNDQPEMF